MMIFLFLAALFYVVPVIKLLHLFIRKILFIPPYIYPSLKDGKIAPSKNLFKWLIFFIARIEYVIQPFRFFIIGFPVLIYFAYVIYHSFKSGMILDVRWFFALLAFSIIILWTRQAKVSVNLRAAEFIRNYPLVHPEIFFSRYKMDLAYGCVDFFSSNNILEIMPNEADFTLSKRPDQRALIFLKGMVDTGYLAHICFDALKKLGKQYVFDVFDQVGSLWGKRILQLSHTRFVIKGAEKLEGKNGKFILVFNHKSSFDFILTFFALSQIKVNNRHLKPRFILAQDHFKDNWLVYNLMAVGKICEAVHMVTISRNNRKKSYENLKLAAKFIVEKDIAVAIYPQGTRAAGNYDRSLKRRDAGYYTTISKRDLTSDLAHIKKGTSYLIFDTLLELNRCANSQELNIVFIGIKGAGITFPKSSIKVQTESEIEFKVGDVVSLSPHLMEELSSSVDSEEFDHYKKKFLSEMNYLINNKLKEVLGHDQMLTQRYLTELKGQFRFDDDKIDAVKSSLLESCEETDGVYHILDRVYSLPTPQWNGYLSQLSQLLLEKSDQSRLQLLLEEVSGELLRAK